AGENALEKVEKDAQFVNDKNGAKKELETEKNRIAGLIDNVKGVDQRDKDEALEALKTALTEALDQVQASKTDEDVQAAVQDGKNAMQEILDDLRALGSGNIEDAKENAKLAIEDEAEKAKTVIDNLSNLSEEEKTAAKDQVDQKA